MLWSVAMRSAFHGSADCQSSQEKHNRKTQTNVTTPHWKCMSRIYGFVSPSIFPNLFFFLSTLLFNYSCSIFLRSDIIHISFVRVYFVTFIFYDVILCSKKIRLRSFVYRSIGWTSKLYPRFSLNLLWIFLFERLPISWFKLTFIFFVSKPNNATHFNLRANKPIFLEMTPESFEIIPPTVYLYFTVDSKNH